MSYERKTQAITASTPTTAAAAASLQPTLDHARDTSHLDRIWSRATVSNVGQSPFAPPSQVQQSTRGKNNAFFVDDGRTQILVGRQSGRRRGDDEAAFDAARQKARRQCHETR